MNPSMNVKVSALLLTKIINLIEDVVSRKGAAPGDESQARRRSRRPLRGHVSLGALTFENGQGNDASVLPLLPPFRLLVSLIDRPVTPSVISDATVIREGPPSPTSTALNPFYTGWRRPPCRDTKPEYRIRVCSRQRRVRCRWTVDSALRAACVKEVL